MGRAHKLIKVLVCDHGKGGGVEEDVVVLVLGPEGGQGVAQAVVEERPEVSRNPNDEKLKDKVAPAENGESAESLRLALRHEPLLTENESDIREMRVNNRGGVDEGYSRAKRGRSRRPLRIWKILSRTFSGDGNLGLILYCHFSNVT